MEKLAIQSLTAVDDTGDEDMEHEHDNYVITESPETSRNDNDHKGELYTY